MVLIATYIISILSIFFLCVLFIKKYKKSPVNYNIAFGDSGVGGLIFAIDNYQKTISYLHKTESQYYIKFNLYHIGDSANAPYGIKKPSEIKKLTNNFLDYMVNNLNSQIAIVACNTASILFNIKYQQEIKYKFPNSIINPIIKESIAELYNQGQIITNELGIKEIHLGILATKATINSNIYEKYLKKIHHKINPNIKLFIYQYYPKNWVENIEYNIKNSKLKEDVFFDLNKMLKKFPNIKNISALGLFCTHFSFLLDDIKEFAAQNLENKNLRIITQGALFSDKIKYQINKDLAKMNIKKRQKFLKTQRIIGIKSFTTGQNKKQIYSIVKTMFPKLSNRININKIPQIKSQ